MADEPKDTKGSDQATGLPDCGLYRTGLALLEHEETVPAGALIMFHNHSNQGPPLVLTPHQNTNNRWAFHEKGYLVHDEAFLEALVPRKPQGFYLIEKHIHVGREEILPERTLVQLGYNRDADPILFVGQFVENSIQFPTKGYRFTNDKVYAHLAPAGFAIPVPQRVLH